MKWPNKPCNITDEMCPSLLLISSDKGIDIILEIMYYYMHIIYKISELISIAWLQ